MARRRRKGKPRPWLVLGGRSDEGRAEIASRWPTKALAWVAAAGLRRDGLADWVDVLRERSAVTSAQQ